MKLIGGERIGWTSRPGLESPTYPSGSALGALLKKLDGGFNRTLVVGRLGLDLIAEIAERSACFDIVTPDLDFGEAVQQATASHKQVGVFCGAPDRFVAEEPYDLIICIAGVGGSSSPDSSIQSQRALNDLVASWADQQATVFLGIENDWGLADFVNAESSEYSHEGDSDWPAGAYWQPSISPIEVESLASALEFEISSLYGVYGSPSSIDVLADRSALTLPVDGFLTESASSAFARSIKGQSTVDPYLAARKNIDGGLGLVTAPGWLLVMTRGTKALELPQAIVSKPVASFGSSVDWFLRDTGVSESWQVGDTKLLNLDSDVIWVTNPLKDVTRSKKSIATDLGAALSSKDRSLATKFIREYVAFVREDVDLEQAPFASLYNVGNDGMELAVIDSTWSAANIDVEAAIAMSLLQFSFRHLTSGAPHLWQNNLSADELAVRLSLLGGLDSRSLLSKAVELECRIESAMLGSDDQAANLRYVSLRRCYSQRMTTGLAASSIRSEVNNRLYVDTLVRRIDYLERTLVPTQQQAFKSAMQVEAKAHQVEEIKTQLSSSNASLVKVKESRENIRQVKEKLKSRLAVEQEKNLRIKSSRAFRFSLLLAKPIRVFRRKRKS